MPIYEYQCQTCGNLCEEMQKVSDEPLKTCPQCGKDSLKKIVSSTSFQLKGSGYYATDYKKSPAKESPKEPAPETPKESKPEKKDETK